jgi:hypothetical protein
MAKVVRVWIAGRLVGETFFSRATYDGALLALVRGRADNKIVGYYYLLFPISF